MNKDEIIKAYCQLSAQVAEGVFDHNHAADCFCGTNTLALGGYRYEPAVLDYIRIAVHRQMREDGYVIPKTR